MIIHDVEQGTQEWLRVRFGVITASNADKILTPKTKKPSTQVEYSEKPPTYEEVDKTLSGPRVPVKKRLLTRSLGSFGFFGGA